MKNISSFLAHKYLAFGKESNIAFMTRICFLGIFIGTFCLMLTLVITNGFEKVICEKLQGINSPITITAHHQKLDITALRNYITKEFGTKIAGISPGSIHQIIIDHNDTQSVLFLKGIEANSIDSVSSIGKKVTLPPIKNNAMQTLLTKNHIILGYKAAQSLGLAVGDAITILIPEPASNKKILLTKQKAIVAGIFTIGFDEYDSNVAYTSLDFFNTLFDTNTKNETETAEFLYVSPTLEKPSLKKRLLSLLPINIHDETDALAHQLRARLPELTISSWRELSPALVASLKLEKYVMFFILALITLVASMNMISLLFMQISYKRRDIAIFKSMGMPAKMINRIFLKMGMFITLTATLAGLAFAALAGLALEAYPCIQLPDVYFVSHLPARVEPELFIVVFVATIILGLCATVLPALRAQRINITEVLRQE